MSQLVLGGGTVDLQTGAVNTRLGELSLTDIELRVLLYLHQHRDRVIPREELLEHVWGYAPGVRSRTVDTTVQRLRAKIEADPSQPAHLHTVRGTGYRLELPDESEPRPPSLGTIPRLERLIGREAELRSLRALLQRGATRITLTGPSGVGKTWLARRALTEFSDAGRESTWFASLEGARTSRDLLHSLSDALQLGQSRDPAAEIVAHLSRAPSIGALDDLQALDDEALALLSAILRQVPRLTAIVTSQRLLGLEGEHRLEVAPLELASSLVVLRERLAALALALPSPAELEALAARAEGLPLALELLCPLLEVLPVSRLLALPDLLAVESDRADLPLRHRSLRAAVLTSLGLLSPAELAVLSQLTVFAGAFSLEAAEAVACPPSDVSLVSTLSVLSRRSLLRRLPSGGLILDGPVRAQLRAQPDSARPAVRARHAAWLIRLWEPRRVETLIPWRLDLQECLQQGPIDTVEPLAQALCSLVGRIGPVEALPAVFIQALERDLPDLERVRLLHLLSEAHNMASRLEDAEQVARQGLQLAERISAPRETVELLTQLSRALSHSGRYEEGVQAGEEAVARAEALADPSLLYMALEFLATTHGSCRQAERARPMHERAAEIARALGQQMHLAISLTNLANNLRDDAPQRETLLREALSLVEGRQYPRLEGVIWGNLANRLADQLRGEEAEQAYVRARQILTQAGDPSLMWTFALRHGAEMVNLGRREEGRLLMREAREFLRDRLPQEFARAEIYVATVERDMPLLLEAHPDDQLAASARALMRGEPPPSDAVPAELRVLRALLGPL